MKNNNFIRTVLGDVSIDELGFTLPHEHCFCTQLAVFTNPSNDKDRLLAYEQVTSDNAKRIRENPLINLDNIFLSGGILIENELNNFYELGGRSIVDLTTIGINRNVNEVIRLSKSTGVNIIIGAGYYIEKSHPPNIIDKTEEEIAGEIISDIKIGIDGTAACAGIIGEIGTSMPILYQERKVLSAAVIASNKTGCSIIVHVQPPAWLGHDVLDILVNEGANLEKVALAHIDSTINSNSDYHKELLSRGTTIIYDGFGTEWDFPTLGLEMPSDRERIESLVKLVESGFIGQLLISHDVCTKVHTSKYYGPGYSHILKEILPLISEMGFSDAQINKITCANPANFLSIDKEQKNVRN